MQIQYKELLQGHLCSQTDLLTKITLNIVFFSLGDETPLLNIKEFQPAHSICITLKNIYISCYNITLLH